MLATTRTKSRNKTKLSLAAANAAAAISLANARAEAKWRAFNQKVENMAAAGEFKHGLMILENLMDRDSHNADVDAAAAHCERTISMLGGTSANDYSRGSQHRTELAAIRALNQLRFYSIPAEVQAEWKAAVALLMPLVVRRY